jgi:hypothetical protein
MAASSTSIQWLLRLRWGAVAGQRVTVLVVHRLIRIALPLGSLFGCIGITALSHLPTHI